MNAIRTLERSALAAFRRGIGWAEFWERHAEQVRECEPFNRQRFKRLYDRLLALVTSGDSAGQYPIDDGVTQWEVDDARPGPHDTITQARFDWAQLSGNEVTA
jgi:hypothetical protein